MTEPLRAVVRTRLGELLLEGRFRAEYRALEGDRIVLMAESADGRRISLEIPCALLEDVPSAESQELVVADLARRAEDLVLARHSL